MPDVKVLANGNVLVSIPIILRESAGRKRIITDEKKFKADEDPIVLNIARGFYWQEMIDNGKIANVRELANILNVNESYVARTIRLSMLSPEIIHRAIRGTLPPDISLAKLYKLSSRWDGLRNTFSVNSLKSRITLDVTFALSKPCFIQFDQKRSCDSEQRFLVGK